MTSLFIFRLDLRLKDNLGLIQCFKNSKKIYLTFIFDPKQIDESENKYFSHNCVQFMVESLKELYKKSDKKLIQQTHVFSYFIIKTALLFNIIYY